MSAAELQSMKTELERLHKAEHMEANKTAEAQRKIEFRKLAAQRLSQETEEEESSQSSSPKCIRRNLPTDDNLDQDEEALRTRARRQNILTKIMKIIKISEKSLPTGKRKRSLNGTRKEQVTLSILEKSVRDLAIAGHDYLCITTKASFSWKHMEEAVASCKELKQLMEQELKMWKSVSSMRETVANKARETIGDVLGLSGIKRDDIVEAVEWMLKDLKKVHKGGEGNDDISLPFISSDLDIKNKTFNHNKPFGNHFFLCIYHLFFIGNNPDGVHYVQHFRNSSLPLLALITSVNLQKKAPRWTMKMSEEMYQNVLEDSNITYLLHIEDDGEGDSRNSRQEGKIDVDYDALEVSAA
ncbi:hypothetical protein BDR06DRAFT_973629 [Suillus hirtellus]|nr:hypothetical protein BDR06DRAFT_973629 [Suillus hirtellus]